MDFIGWNLISMEEQVISRAHRMGATRPIHVETLAMRSTIEEQMLAFLQVNSYKDWFRHIDTSSLQLSSFCFVFVFVCV